MSSIRRAVWVSGLKRDPTMWNISKQVLYVYVTLCTVCVCVCVYNSVQMCYRRIVGEWRLNSRPLALLGHQVTSEGRLVLPQVDLSHEGNYSCHDNHGLFLHAVRLKLGCAYFFRSTRHCR